MTGQITDRLKINLKTLAQKAKKDDKALLYYDNSKSKINSIIRKNQLPNFITSYLWQNKIYKKELVRNQKILPEEIRKDIIDNCINSYTKNPWTSILRSFLKLHNPLDDEITTLINLPTNSCVALECWDIKLHQCHNLNFDIKLYDLIKTKLVNLNEYESKRIIGIISTILSQIPEMRMPLMYELLNNSYRLTALHLLKAVLKITAINDEVINFMLTNTNETVFKDIIKYAIHRQNISDNMIAKIYLAVNL